MWAFALLNVSTNIASYGLGAFLPTIVASMGFETLTANLLTAPVYLWMAVFNIAVATCADRYRERGWVIVVVLVASAGVLVLYWLL